MKNLKMQYTIFIIILFTALSSIVISEKMLPLMSNKVDKKLINYYNTNLKDKINSEEVNIEKTVYKDTIFQKKITNKTNKNLFFTITYKNKKASDNYKENYYEGKEFIKYITNKIKKEINNKTNKKAEVSINKKYNEFNNKIKKRLLEEDNLLSLSIYTIKVDLTSELNVDSIKKQIIKTNDNYEKNNIIPNNYNFNITDTKDITKSVIINNLKPEIIKSDDLTTIINDIMNNEKSTIIKKNNITFKKEA